MTKTFTRQRKPLELTPEQSVGYKYIDEGRKHLHTYDGAPLRGTSSVGDIIAKTLHWWSAELAAVTCLEAGEHIPTIREEYLAVSKLPYLQKKAGIKALEDKYPIFKKARWAHDEVKNNSADKGTDMHAELERYVKNCIKDNQGKPFLVETGEDVHKAVVLFSIHAVDEVEKFLWSEGHCYSTDPELWVGGISDCGALLKNGKGAIYDFKSSKDAYFSHFLQATLYGMQIKENGVVDKNGNLVLRLDKPIGAVCVVPFGSEDPTPQVRYDIDDLETDVKCALRLAKRNN